jgi:flagellar FliL protein
MAKPTPNAGGSGETGARKSRKKVLMVLGAMLVLLSSVGGAGAWFLSGSRNGHAGSENAGPEKAPLFLPLENFTVNLQGETGDQYLQVGLTLKLDDQAQIDLLKLHMPEVRSRLLMLLSSKKGSEILTPEGKKKLADEIIAQVRQPLTVNSAPQGVSAVFFTSFVVQ